MNALCWSKLSAEQLRIIDGWRDGSAPLAGLTVDADLFWTLLSALVAHGAATTADIEAAAAADPTALPASAGHDGVGPATGRCLQGRRLGTPHHR